MNTKSEGRRLIDSVVYLASLASNPQAIDILIDEVRVITANLPVTNEPTEPQKIKLLQIKQGLEEYLVSQEQMRIFTPESLQLQLEQHIRGDNTKGAMRHLIGVGIVTLLVTGLVALATYRLAPSIRAQVIGTSFFAMLHIGAVWLFVSALKLFTTRLRAAFRWICAGIIIFGFTLIAQPIIEFLGLRATVFSSFFGLVPAVIPAIVVFIGVWLYARLFKVSARKVVGALGGAVILFVLLTLLLPHAPSHLSAMQYITVTSIQGITSAISAASVVLLYLTGRRMADLYLKSTTSLELAIALASIISLYTYIYRIMFGGLTSGPAVWIIITLVSIMGFAFLHSGYVFNKATRY